jgi:hypothetical protein
MMTIETERPTFRGVTCLHCKEPVPVPAIVWNLKLPTTEGADPRTGKSQVFNVRCPSCHKEKPYRVSEILDFEGSPDRVVRPASPTPVRWYPQDGLARSAKA